MDQWQIGGGARLVAVPIRHYSAGKSGREYGRDFGAEHPRAILGCGQSDALRAPRSKSVGVIRASAFTQYNLNRRDAEDTRRTQRNFVGAQGFAPLEKIRGNIMTTIANLKTEYRTNPLGIDGELPRLSWQMESDASGAKQTAYQVRAASSADQIGQADLWDSGKIESDQSVHVV